MNVPFPKSKYFVLPPGSPPKTVNESSINSDLLLSKSLIYFWHAFFSRKHTLKSIAYFELL